MVVETYEEQSTNMHTTREALIMNVAPLKGRDNESIRHVHPSQSCPRGLLMQYSREMKTGRRLGAQDNHALSRRRRSTAEMLIN
jgi:hypothetical protein